MASIGVLLTAKPGVLYQLQLLSYCVLVGHIDDEVFHEMKSLWSCKMVHEATLLDGINWRMFKQKWAK